ncbi:MAG TPA: class I SAM-dependent methyltransferase, partial [Myxococcota bacterium]
TTPQDPTTPPASVAPHTPIQGYYQSEDTRHDYVIDLFDKSARHYNTIEKLFLNGGLAYRRFSLYRAGLRRGMKVLDVAIGTAAVARGAERLVGPEGRVFGVDPSSGMLAQARRVVRAPLTRGVAEELPFADDRFDFVTMGLALRHVSDLVKTFGEYYRVLAPGGTLWILDTHVPPSGIVHSLSRFFWARMVPGMTLFFTRSRDAKVLMDYYWDTIEKSVPPEIIVQAMRDVGFQHVRSQVTMPGATCEYTAKKPLREN